MSTLLSIIASLYKNSINAINAGLLWEIGIRNTLDYKINSLPFWTCFWIALSISFLSDDNTNNVEDNNLKLLNEVVKPTVVVIILTAVYLLNGGYHFGKIGI